MIKSSRQRKGWTQLDLVNNLQDISLSKIKKIESGQFKKIKHSELLSIYKVLDLDLNQIIDSEKSKRSFRLNERHLRVIRRVSADKNFENDSQALTYILENYEDVVQKNSLNDEELIEKIKPLFDFYFKSSLLPILKKVLMEYKIDENILERIEKNLEDFELQNEKEIERTKEYAKIHVQKYQ